MSMLGIGCTSTLPASVPAPEATATPVVVATATPTASPTRTGSTPTVTPSLTAPPVPPTPVPPTTRSRTTSPLPTETPTPVPEIHLTILYDNNPGDRRLRTDWGFACLVEGLAQTILFDTGAQGDLLLANMATLGVSVGDIDSIVLSHAHGDHTGGLAAVLDAAEEVVVYLPHTFPEDLKRRVREAGADLVEVHGPVEVCPGATVTGVVGDAIPEQGLVIEGPAGLVVITGCAHPGIVEMVRAAMGTAAQGSETAPPAGPAVVVDLVLGGFHLGSASDAQIDRIVADLRALNVQRVAPCHCSGPRARQRFEMSYGSDYVPVGVGSRLTIGTAGE